MNWYFNFSEFITLDDPEYGEQTFLPTPDVTDKIVKNFMIPLQLVRADIGMPVYIRSCYRPNFWERKKGRPETSQHTFKGEGACDVTSNNLMKLFMSLSEGDHFTRICYYPEQRFFHIDRKTTVKQFFINRDGWERVSKNDIESMLK